MTYPDQLLSGYKQGEGGNQPVPISALQRPLANTVDPWQCGVPLGLLAETLAADALDSSQH